MSEELDDEDRQIIINHLINFYVDQNFKSDETISFLRGTEGSSTYAITLNGRVGTQIIDKLKNQFNLSVRY